MILVIILPVVTKRCCQQYKTKRRDWNISVHNLLLNTMVQRWYQLFGYRSLPNDVASFTKSRDKIKFRRCALCKTKQTARVVRRVDFWEPRRPSAVFVCVLNYIFCSEQVSYRSQWCTQSTDVLCPRQMALFIRSRPVSAENEIFYSIPTALVHEKSLGQTIMKNSSAGRVHGGFVISELKTCWCD